MKKILLLTVFAVFISGCTSVPITGRQQLSLVSTSSILQLSSDNYNQIIRESDVIYSGPDAMMVKKVGQKIAKAAEEFLQESGLSAEIYNYQWEFNLIKEDNTANAFCMPGGRVVVYTGILPFTKNEEGLAVVIGHEVAHAIAKHGEERMSQEMLVNFGGMALSKAMSEKSQATQDLFLSVYGVGTNLGVLLPYSRKHELEADRVGLILMARAGYDPNKAVSFWKDMSSGGSASPEFLSTHPSDSTRISEIQKYIPEAMGYYKK